MDLEKLSEKDKAILEEISEEIRKGCPVSIIDAFAAIEYQEALRLGRRWWKFWVKT